MPFAMVFPTGPARLVRAVIGLALVVAIATPAMAQSPRPDSFADLAERLTPSVVNISTTQTVERRRMPDNLPFPPGTPFDDLFRDFFERNAPEGERQSRRATSLGSGVIIDAEGYIVTNYHVIDGADEINAILADGTVLRDARVVGRDEKTDLALLKVETEEDLVPAQWGDSTRARVGDWVLAIGNPFGLGGTVTAGIISARARNINSGPYDDYIQTDASINRGNSGGPLFNLDGEVIGINTAIFSPTGGSVGIGFSIPSSLARVVIDDLREFGRTRRGWLGVRIQQVDEEFAESLGLDEPRGALVASVNPEGPARAAGIQPGDVILTFDGKEVEEMRRLPRIVAETAIGREVGVEVFRDGEVVSLKVTVGELEEAEEQGLLDEDGEPGRGDETEDPSSEDFDALGLKLAAIDDSLRDRFDLGDDADGVVVVEVTEDSEAAEKGIRAGNLIDQVNQERVATPEDVREKIAAAREMGRPVVLLRVVKPDSIGFVSLRVDGDGR